MTAWTTTARSAARLQPVKEELMWLKVLRGCASRSISLNAFFTPVFLTIENAICLLKD